MKTYYRLTYTEAIETLQKSSHEFKFKPEVIYAYPYITFKDFNVDAY